MYKGGAIHGCIDALWYSSGDIQIDTPVYERWYMMLHFQSSKLTDAKTLNANACKKCQLHLQILEQGKILRLDIGNTYSWVEMFVLWAITKYEWISISKFLTVFIASSKHFIHLHINKCISSSNSSPM